MLKTKNVLSLKICVSELHILWALYLAVVLDGAWEIILQ